MCCGANLQKLPLAEYCYCRSPLWNLAVQTQPAVALVILIYFFTHAQTISIIMLKLLGLHFGMLSEHKNWQFEPAGVRKLSAKQFTPGKGIIQNLQHYKNTKCLLYHFVFYYWGKYKMSVGPHFDSFVTLRCDNSIKIDFDCFVTPSCYKTIKMRPNGHFVFFTLEKMSIRC
jgi:hypothetical protein